MSNNYSEKIEDINALEQVLQMMQNEIQRVKSHALQAKEYAPEATEAAIEKLENAENYWSESNEQLQETKEILEEFLTQARIARETYDEHNHSPSSHTEREAARARRQADKSYVSLENAINKTRSKIAKTDSYINKAQSRVKIALLKAQAEEEREDNKKVRINFTLPEFMKNDWQGLAEDLSTSVSQMIREAMTLYTSELKKAEGNLERGLTKFGAKMEQVGQKVEDYVGKNVEKRYDPETGRLKSIRVKGKEVFPNNPNFMKVPEAPNTPPAPNPPASPSPTTSMVNKDRIKKRVTGLIRIQKSLPIEKLAQSLEITEEQAENIIYELAADGVDGTLKDGVFKYKASDDEIIEILHKIVDRMR